MYYKHNWLNKKKSPYGGEFITSGSIIEWERYCNSPYMKCVRFYNGLVSHIKTICKIRRIR